MAIGIDRRIKQTWLDTALDRVPLARSHSELRAFLDASLRGELAGPVSRAKVVGIVVRIWCDIPARCMPLLDDALRLVPEITRRERVWLHWGMTALAYPFFRDVAEAIGHLLSHQDQLTPAQVLERIRRQWGNRASTKENAHRLLCTMVDWGVLRRQKPRGHFGRADKLATSSAALKLWLLEALLRASPTAELEARQLVRLPEAFPFTLEVTRSDLREYDRFKLHRNGEDIEMVSVRLRPTQRLYKRAGTKQRLAGVKHEAASRSRTSVLPVTREPDARECPALVPEVELAGSSGAIAGEAAEIARIALQVAQLSPELDRLDQALIDGEGSSASAQAVIASKIQRFDPVFCGPFRTQSSECLDLFSNGRFYRCIALAQAVVEAIVRQVWRAWVRPSHSKTGTLSDNLKVLCAMGVISTELKNRLDLLWIGRNEYYRLNGTLQATRTRLEELAGTHVRMLIELDRVLCGSFPG
jgi:hypothetical protein